MIKFAVFLLLKVHFLLQATKQFLVIRLICQLVLLNACFRILVVRFIAHKILVQIWIAALIFLFEVYLAQLITVILLIFAFLKVDHLAITDYGLNLHPQAYHFQGLSLLHLSQVLKFHFLFSMLNFYSEDQILYPFAFEVSQLYPGK